MYKLITISFLFALYGCVEASDVDNSSTSNTNKVCEFKFDSIKVCTYKKLLAQLITTPVGADELLLKSIKVQVDKSSMPFYLDISPDTSMVEGDKGYILFEDINFDGSADLAITTSFGVANLYLDYWVFDSKNNKYIFAGNYSRLTPNHQDKTLVNNVKLNAAQYERNTYYWDGFKLIKKL